MTTLSNCWIWDGTWCQLNWGSIGDWAQVIGASLGLFIAWRLGNKQSKDQYESAIKLINIEFRFQGLNRLKIVEARMKQILDYLDLLLDIPNNKYDFIIDWSSPNDQLKIQHTSQELYDDLVAINLFELPTAEAAVVVAHTRSWTKQLLDNTLSAIHNQKQNVFNKQEFHKIMRSTSDQILWSLDDIRAEIAKIST